MPKITLPSIASGYLNVDDMNTAFQQIENAIENTLSRDGATPNNMEADLDLDGNKLINVAAGTNDNDAVTVGQLNAAVDARASGVVIQRIEQQTPSNGATVLTFTALQYEPGANNLALFKNGVRLFVPGGYAETSSTSVTLVVAANGTDVFTAVVNEFLGTVEEATGDVAWARLINIPDFATRWPTYAEVTGKPATFTPATHAHATTDITSGVSFADGYRGVFVQSTTPTATRTGDVWLW